MTIRTRKSMSRRSPTDKNPNPQRSDPDPKVVDNILDEIESWNSHALVTPSFDPDEWPDPREVVRMFQSRKLFHHLMQVLQDKSEGRIGRYIRLLGGKAHLYPDAHLLVEVKGGYFQQEVRSSIRAGKKYWMRYGDLHIRPATDDPASNKRLITYVAAHREDHPWFSWCKENVGWRPLSIVGSSARPTLGIPSCRRLVDSRTRTSIPEEIGSGAE